MIRSERKRQGGFTLLEMLIAMAVFAVMSMVAYQGLRAVLDADHITREQAQRLADLQVTLSVLERDLAQVVDVRVRDEFGDPLPPLRLRAGGEHQLLELVRAGAGGDQRLRRTAWQITERGLERRLWPGVDIVDPESMRVRPLPTWSPRTSGWEWTVPSISLCGPRPVWTGWMPGRRRMPIPRRAACRWQSSWCWTSPVWGKSGG